MAGFCLPDKWKEKETCNTIHGRKDFLALTTGMINRYPFAIYEPRLSRYSEGQVFITI